MVVEIKSKRDIRQLQVSRCEYVSANLRRITLTGDDLSGFPAGYESGYLKLYLPDSEGGDYVRTFTIRKQRSERNEIDLDFALHQGLAPASNWAERAKPGDSIRVSGPGAVKLVDHSAPWFLLASDMTGLPALSVNLEKLPAAARGYALIEVVSEQDIHTIDAPAAMNIIWVVNNKPGLQSLLLEKIKALEWLEGLPSIWAACEFSAMQGLRDYFKREKGIPKEALYISSYWKHGVAEDEHKRLKRRDLELNDT